MNSLTTHTNGPRSKNLTRDQRVAIQTLRRHGLSQQAIARELGITLRQVQYSCQRGTVLDAKVPGRPPVLNEMQVDELENYVRSSREGRFMSFLELSMYPFSHWNVGEKAIRNALIRRGYSRCISQRKPPLNDINRRKRLLFAQTHLSWTVEQWSQILWTDESWITGGQHARVWVTRKAGEAYDDSCVSSRFVRRSGWMFWGSFFGTQKGPILVWEKKWGTMTSKSYCEHILPLIKMAKESNPSLLLMQDGAACHASQSTMEVLHAEGIEPIVWPPFSPDLNPIESIWNSMKNYIQAYHPEVEMGRQLPSAMLKRAIIEAWDSINSAELGRLIASMPARCQAVIEANGGPTRY